MALSIEKPSFAAGELAPALWGRTDLNKFHIGASVMRNMFVNYRGPASSRAGTAFVGGCKQLGTRVPPRLIEFRFNLFQSYMLEFGDFYMRVIANGAYVLEPSLNIESAAKTNPCRIGVSGHDFVAGDSIYITGVVGMTRLNGRTFQVLQANPTLLLLGNTIGEAIDATNYAAYASGGTAARVYTLITPYAAVDLPYLKFAQSADTMTLTCVNPKTGVEYAPLDLLRNAPADWSLMPLNFGAGIDAPNLTGITSTSTASPGTQYQYVVTAVDAVTGLESVRSNIGTLSGSVDISQTAGSVTVTWEAVAGAGSYNIYRAPAAYGNDNVPIGSLFGYVGTALGLSFVDSNITPDLTKTPPLHINPFARGAILSCVKTAAGTGYVQASTTVSISPPTGTGAVLLPVVVDGDIVSIIVESGGEGYIDSDAIVIADSSGGSGAEFKLNVGPQTGTYPAVVSYFQQRRVYAATLNNPDTYFLSQAGGFKNMDASTPPIASDAITGSPWAQQVNGIQWALPGIAGMLVATGNDVWQVAGTGGSTNPPITPSQQIATPQETNGFSPTMPPLKIAYDLLYVQALGSAVRDTRYNFLYNVYSGTDVSMLSSHLFDGYALREWCWAREPNKIVWAVRSDGKFLSLTYQKDQDLVAWSRHDTNGQMVSVASIPEPPVDAVYFIVKRYIPGPAQWAYYVERMDNRLWDGPEDPWCVDCGLSLVRELPDAMLTAAAAQGPGNISGAMVSFAGDNYTAEAGVIITDPSGTGSGGKVSLTVTGGKITGVSIISAGQNYSPSTFATVTDNAGTGAQIVLQIAQVVRFYADVEVFGTAAVGDVIRVGGGRAAVTRILDNKTVDASIDVPIIDTVPNDPNKLPLPAPSGQWSLARPTVTVTNLDHLEGMTVTGLADGAVIPPQVVANGTITLPSPASAVVVGLPFVAQLQSMHAAVSGAPTIQGKRKKITGGTVRMAKSRGVKVGSDQPVASALDYQREIAWSGLTELADQAAVNMPAASIPLYTGDKYAPISGGWLNWNGTEASPCMMAVQQDNPLPLNVLSLIPDMEIGDNWR